MAGVIRVANVTSLPVEEPSIDALLENIKQRFEKERSDRKQVVINALTKSADTYLWHKE